MKTVINLLAVACLIGSALAASAQQGPSLDDTRTYRMANAGFDRLGQTKCADIFNGGPSNNQMNMQDCAKYSGQYWHLTRKMTALRYLPTYTLTTDFRGPSMCLTLDGSLINHVLHLAPCSDTDNQLWIVESVSGGTAPTGWKISPMLNETENNDAGDFSLVVKAPPEGDGLPYIDKIDYVGNGYIWRLIPVQ